MLFKIQTCYTLISYSTDYNYVYTRYIYDGIQKETSTRHMTSYLTSLNRMTPGNLLVRSM